MARHPPERCPECGQTLSGAPGSYRTLAQENQDLRREVERLEAEVLYWNQGGFISSETARHFHRADCHWAREIATRYRIHYISHEEAVRAGKKPCKTCCS